MYNVLLCNNNKKFLKLYASENESCRQQYNAIDCPQEGEDTVYFQESEKML
jgi:hypothetical protein